MCQEHNLLLVGPSILSVFNLNANKLMRHFDILLSAFGWLCDVPTTFSEDKMRTYIDNKYKKISSRNSVDYTKHTFKQTDNHRHTSIDFRGNYRTQDRARIDHNHIQSILLGELPCCFLCQCLGSWIPKLTKHMTKPLR